MTEKTLAQLYAEHQGKVSDKWTIYLSEYDRIFQAYRDKPVRLFEIGVQNGGSLEIWSSFFRNAKVLVGCDINPDCKQLRYSDPRIAVVVGDANMDVTHAEVLAHSQVFDIIIDDGSHRSSDIVRSFAKYFPHLIDGGVFVAEDLHCSYWQEFEGGLFDPFSSIAFFKRLADILNHEHWGVQRSRSEVLKGFFFRYGFEIDEATLQNLHSIEFVNSMCVIRKCVRQANELGSRFVGGVVAEVMPQVLDLHSKPPLTSPQDANIWTAREISADEELFLQTQEFATAQGQITSLAKELSEREREVAALLNQLAASDEQIASLTQEFSERDEQIAGLSAQVSERDTQIFTLANEVMQLRQSRSWRLTRPLRWGGLQLRRVKRAVLLVRTKLRADASLTQSLRKAVRVYEREGLPGIKRRLQLVEGASPLRPVSGSSVFDRNDYTEWIRQYDTLTDVSRGTLRARMHDFARKPTLSVVMPTYNPRPEWLIDAIESVRRQTYPNWELCIGDDASTDPRIRPILERYASEEPRIKVVFRESNGHISAASNSGLELASGEWVALLDHDDLIAEHALFWIAEAINRQPEVRMIYSDEDKIDEAGKRFGPYFKCDWNQDLFYSHNLFSHLGVYQASLLREIGGFRPGFEGSQDYDVALRCIEKVSPHQVHHIPRVLYHWRVHVDSTAQSLTAKPYALLAGEKALNEHFDRIGVDARVDVSDQGTYRVRYALPKVLPLVSLIIPTRNGLQLIRQCLTSILEKTTYPHYEIVVVDNGSDDPHVLNYFDSLKAETRVRVIRDERPFNYSALNNAAVRMCQGEVIGLINNDIEVISPDWLEEMVSFALQPDIGAVGAKLWYPNETLQHGGVLLGIGGVANHAHHKLNRGSSGYFGRAAVIQSFSAVTAACLIVRREIYDEVNGLDENHLQVAFNDIDFCLRVRRAGYRNVWTPYAELYHHESATRGPENTPEKQARFASEVRYMTENWGGALLADPAYSKNLSLDHTDFSFAWPPRVESL